MLNFRLRFALRVLLKNRLYSLLNIIGLALGLAVSILIYLYVHSEITYDQHFKGHQSVYRVQSIYTLNGRTDKLAGAGFGMGPLMQQFYPEIESAARFMHYGEKLRFTAMDQDHYVDGVIIADSNFIRTMGIELRAGNPETALLEGRSIVLTESYARQFFGDTAGVVGKQISTVNYTYTITGLMEDLPANTHHRFKMLISSFYEPMSQRELELSLWDPAMITFVRLKPGVEASAIEDGFPQFFNQHMAEMGTSLGGEYRIKLTALKDLHFNKGFMFDQPTGNKAYLIAFGGIGFLILILAIINYVNMATARSLKRQREIGMRKILGADRRDILILVLTESLLMSFLALSLAFVLVEISLSFTPLNQVLDKDLSLNFERFPGLWWLPPSLAILVGLCSALYPALILSKVSALKAIRGMKANPGAGLVLRKVLVGFQFTISVAVVITALMMYRQIEFIKYKDLGFSKRNVILIPIQDTVTNVSTLRHDLSKSKYVEATAMATSIVGKGTGRALITTFDAEGQDERHIRDFMRVSAGYFETLEMEFIAGRPFSEEDYEQNRKLAVVNEQMAATLKGDPIGQKISWEYDDSGETIGDAEIIGVVRDFNAHSLHDPIEPLVMGMEKKNLGILHLRLARADFSEAIRDIERIWSQDKINRPFQFSFLQDDLLAQYKEENRQSHLILFLTYMAIFISFLGLTGLASFTTALRTKEIGIRKVLGAEIFQMIQLIFRDMIQLIAFSVLIALPMAYILSLMWLDNFAYRTSLSPLLFIGTAASAVLISYLIVSFHSFKVASTSLVHTLKYE